MLFSLGHGDRVAWLADATPLRVADSPHESAAEAAPVVAAGDPDTVAISAVAADAAPLRLLGGNEVALMEVDVAPAEQSIELFGYLFPDAAEVADGDRAAALVALAAAMAEQAGDPAGGDAAIAPIMTYMGQFIDHDITANTNSDAVTEALRIGVPEIRKQNRSLVVTGLKNLRKGTLGLDSLYGDGPIPGPMSAKLQAAMRDPKESRKLRVGIVTTLLAGPGPVLRPDLPRDQQADLPRVRSIVGTSQFPTSNDLPEALRPRDGTNHWERRAFIGDSRNDENLIIAQLHTAFLRFHNRVVDELGAGSTFEQARQLVTWHYQWLVVNEYLPAICDADVLGEVIGSEAQLYARFLDQHPPAAGGSLPLPLEFSAAAFRFGHSMVRAEYDFNRNFEKRNFRPATFAQLFAFTGNAPELPIGGPPLGVGGHPTLPHNWIIEWDRFIDATGLANRRARKIDTHIAPPLFDMANESAASGGRFQRLAERNLTRGHVLNLPSAQALIAKLVEHGFAPARTLDVGEIASGHTAAAIRAGGFDIETPLWFYVLKEAEIIGGGERLGPVGSRIVAETLVGLIVNDPASYWRRPEGRWSPDEGIKHDGQTITSLPALLRAAGVL